MAAEGHNDATVAQVARTALTRLPDDVRTQVHQAAEAAGVSALDLVTALAAERDPLRRVEVSSSASCCGGPFSLCWRARCAACREWLTKHDFTREDAEASAAFELLSHDCAALTGGGAP